METEETGQTYWDPVLGLAMQFPVTPNVGFFVRGPQAVVSASVYVG